MRTPLGNATRPRIWPAGHNDSANGLVPWPTYWPTSWYTQSGYQPLACPSATTGSPEQPAITFVSTERYTLANSCGSSCTNIAAQSDQTTGGEASPGQPPPVPVAIVGSGFGYLPQLLPFAGQASSLTGPGGVSLLRIQDCAEGAQCPPFTWDTAGSTASQVYIANWTDTSIWLDLNLPIDSTDIYLQSLGQYLSPVSDVSTLTFFLSTGSPANSMGCPVNSGDQLTFTVGNPQSGRTVQPPTINVN